MQYKMFRKTGFGRVASTRFTFLFLVPVLCSLALIGSCRSSSKRVDKDEVIKLTSQANQASLQGHIERDAGKIAAVYTEDAIVLPPGNTKPLIGLAQIKDYYLKGLEGSGRTTAITTDNIRYDVIDENNATEVGRYVIAYKASDTAALTTFKGEMLIVWKRIDGNWKIYLDMWH